MDRKQKRELLHALVSASNAFHNTLKEHGYDVVYGLHSDGVGNIKKLDKSMHNYTSLGKLSIKWDLKE